MEVNRNENGHEIQWLAWAREIQALAQTGLTYSEDHYNTARYTRLMEISAEMISNFSTIGKQPLLDIFLGQRGYATPKIDVRGAVIRDGKVLLVQERSDQRWCMPGGWADVGDVPSEMVAREVVEESGFIVQPVRVVGVYDANRSGRPLDLFHAYKIVYLCEIVGGNANVSDETMAVDFFEFDDLPPLSSQRTHLRHLTDLHRVVKNPAAPVAFD